MSSIWTAGHGIATLDLFCRVLKSAEASLVVDVRSRPYSRWNPQYSQPALRRSLSQWGIEYAWKGQNLGGLDQNVRFEETVAELARLAGTRTIILLCSEASPRHCHRRTMLAPAFQAHGLDVVHLLHDGTRYTEPREPHPHEEGRLF